MRSGISETSTKSKSTCISECGEETRTSKLMVAKAPPPPLPPPQPERDDVASRTTAATAHARDDRRTGTSSLPDHRIARGARGQDFLGAGARGGDAPAGGEVATSLPLAVRLRARERTAEPHDEGTVGLLRPVEADLGPGHRALAVPRVALDRARGEHRLDRIATEPPHRLGLAVGGAAMEADVGIGTERRRALVLVEDHRAAE